jgi:hypothetical protein
MKMCQWDLSECPVNHTCQMHTSRPRHCKTINPSIVTFELVCCLIFIFVLQFQKGYSMLSHELKELIKEELRYYWFSTEPSRMTDLKLSHMWSNPKKKYRASSRRGNRTWSVDQVERFSATTVPFPASESAVIHLFPHVSFSTCTHL